MNRRIRVGIIGSQFISHIHTLSLNRCPQAELFAVASPTPGNAQTLAAKNDIPHHFTDYKKLLAMPEVDMIVVGTPNDTHCQITLDAAAAGKHVVMEKPLCLNLAEADRMIDTARATMSSACELASPQARDAMVNSVIPDRNSLRCP